MTTKKSVYGDTHRHQQSAYESQQWWLSKVLCCNACWVPA